MWKQAVGPILCLQDQFRHKSHSYWIPLKDAYVIWSSCCEICGIFTLPFIKVTLTLWFCTVCELHASCKEFDNSLKVNSSNIHNRIDQQNWWMKRKAPQQLDCYYKSSVETAYLEPWMTALTPHIKRGLPPVRKWSCSTFISYNDLSPFTRRSDGCGSHAKIYDERFLGFIR